MAFLSTTAVAVSFTPARPRVNSLFQMDMGQAPVRRRQG
jgi:hypothetical protein